MDQDRQQPETARRDPCQTFSMPPSRERLTFARSFTQEEVNRISLGLIPQEMDSSLDKM